MKTEQVERGFLDVFVDEFMGKIRRLNLTNEVRMHEGIGNALGAISPGICVFHEYRLEEAGRIDFYVGGVQVGLEVKLRPRAIPPVVRQVLKYAADPEIKGLVLVSMVPFELPETLYGKPVRNVPLYQHAL